MGEEEYRMRYSVYFCGGNECPFVGCDNKWTYEDDTVEALLVPCHGVILLDAVGCADTSGLALALCDAVSWAAHDNVEVHAEDTDTRVVACAKVDVLLDAEAEVAGLGEVALAELVLLDLEATLENFLGLGKHIC